ncbi:MAG: cryptochrome/photolyase family protein [Comamonadaceae bacterium]|jgi:deoxyribodipyrimidine photolyase-related protein|nr:cryptochrome/photolyase family protein [Comamonadaceae bacterium]
MTTRRLILLLGDQLDADSSALSDADAALDVVVMIEAQEESTHVRSHKIRTALFLSAMRHFAQELRERGLVVHYRGLDGCNDLSLAAGLKAAIAQLQPQEVIGVEPGDLRVRDQLQAAVPKGLPLRWRADTHFACSLPRFAQWAGESRQLRMEFFYRHMRKEHGILMEGSQPAGGQWNYDADNRRSFGKAGPKNLPQPTRFEPDRITKEVLALVANRYADHPGDLTKFHWPVNRAQALKALDDFIEHRLPLFGAHQDAMWTGMTWGWHALLSSALNLKLLNPLEVVRAAERAWRERGLELSSVEGFIRQVLGWREFMRGVYFLDMPGLKAANHFKHQRPLPGWYWSGQTRMNCMRQCIGQTLEHGYSHHIQRLMVTGMFGVLAQIEPQQLCDWYLAVYVDAVEWVELPNTAGMALFATGPRFTSKPYVASGAYIDKMSNYCKGCAYDPKRRTGDTACPMTTLYWHFLKGHETELAGNPRTALMVKNLQRIEADEMAAIEEHAQSLLANLERL